MNFEQKGWHCSFPELYHRLALFCGVWGVPFIDDDDVFFSNAGQLTAWETGSKWWLVARSGRFRTPSALAVPSESTFTLKPPPLRCSPLRSTQLHAWIFVPLACLPYSCMYYAERVLSFSLLYGMLHFGRCFAVLWYFMSSILFA